MRLTLGRLSIELRWRPRLDPRDLVCTVDEATNVPAPGHRVGEPWGISGDTSSANVNWDPALEAFQAAHPWLRPGAVCRNGDCVPCHA